MKPEMPIPVTVGKTLVRVMRLDINEQTGHERVVQIDEGVVVQDNMSFVRVFNPAPPDKGGDTVPEVGEMFPLLSHRLWCEAAGERKTEFPIPATLK